MGLMRVILIILVEDSDRVLSDWSYINSRIKLFCQSVKSIWVINSPSFSNTFSCDPPTKYSLHTSSIYEIRSFERFMLIKSHRVVGTEAEFSETEYMKIIFVDGVKIKIVILILS